MGKRRTTKKQGREKGNQKQVKTIASSNKRGTKSKKEVIENLFEAYTTGNPPQVCNLIQGWERESGHKEEDIEMQEEEMDIIVDPRNTRGRLSIFHQSIQTYWTFKCVLAKAVTSLQEVGGDLHVVSQVISILQDIKNELQDIRVSQHHATARLGRIERQIQTMHQVDMPGSTVKDLAPVESSDD